MRKKIGCRRPVNLFPCSPALICDTWMIKHRMRCLLSRSLARLACCLFFLIKVRSTATSYKKKKYLYITRRSVHHHHTNNARKQTHPTKYYTTINWERKRKKPPRTAPSSPTLCHAKIRGPLQGKAATRTPPPRNYHPQAAHTRPSIPLFQWCFSRTLPSQRR